MLSSAELHDGRPPPEDSLPLFTDSSDSQTGTQFSMETYSKNLKTSLLGHTLLYTEIATSTMDLLEG